MTGLGAPSLVDTATYLALGIEPRDAVGGGRVPHLVRAAVESVPQPPSIWRNLDERDRLNRYLPKVPRHQTCRYALVYPPGLKRPIDLRLYDTARLFVPRRFRLDIASENEVAALDADGASVVPLRNRVFRPLLFPGAAYPVSGCATGLRGRVLRDGKPMRWARAQATLAATGELLGRTQGDDRGEFLLLLNWQSDHVGDPPDNLEVAVEVAGPKDPPDDPARPEAYRWQRSLDELWDVPQELPTLPAPAGGDPVADGTQPFDDYGYAPGRGPAVRIVVPLGRIVSPVRPFAFIPAV